MSSQDINVYKQPLAEDELKYKQPQTQLLNKDIPFKYSGAEDLDEDEHFDDQVTESNETDNELMNNLQSFKYKESNINALDSDAESDAGSTSYRFSLGLQQVQNIYGNSDSENESDTFFNKKVGRKDEIDDIGINDISEHSSDEIDSDSDEVTSPLMKQIKKDKKRKRRKMEAIKKAQAAAQNGKKADDKKEGKNKDKGTEKQNKEAKKESKTEKKEKDNAKSSEQKKEKKSQKAPEQIKQKKEKTDQTQP